MRLVVTIPRFNGADSLPTLHRGPTYTRERGLALPDGHEFIFVENVSADVAFGSFRRFAAQESRASYLTISRNLDQEIAVGANLVVRGRIGVSGPGLATPGGFAPGSYVHG